MKRSFIHSLPVRLSIWICSILLLILLLALACAGYFGYRNLKNKLDEQGVNTAVETAYKLDRIFVQAEQTAKLLSTILELQHPQADELSELLDNAIKETHIKCPELSGLAVAFAPDSLKKGQKYAFFLSYEKEQKFFRFSSTGPKFDYFNRDWYLVPMTLKKSVWTIPFHSEGGMNSQLLSYATPFFTRDAKDVRQPAGVVVIDIRIGDLAKFLDNHAVTGLKNLSHGGEIFLTNQFGQIVLYPGHDNLSAETLFTLCDASGLRPANRQAAQAVYHAQSGHIRLDQSAFPAKNCELFHAACSNGWIVSCLVPQNWQTAILLPMAGKILLAVLPALALIVLVIFGICAGLTRPLVHLAQAAREVGQGNFAASLPESQYDDEIGKLTASFRQMQHALADYMKRLEETISARERTEGELNAAKAIQRDILPHILPPLPACRNLICAADLLPARGVGGDLYDLFALDENHWALIIGDVSGKGIPAALFMAVTQTLQRSIVRNCFQPGKLVTELNRMLAEDNSTMMFVTYWLGILDVRNGKLEYTNAGHNPPFLKHNNGEVSCLTQRHGPALGVVPGRQYQSSTLNLHPGDSLILYTDGVTEAFNAQKQMFGEERLNETILFHNAASPQELLESLRSAVLQFTNGFEQSDDITMLIAQFGTPQRKESITVPAKPERLTEVFAMLDQYPDIEKLQPASRNMLEVCLEELFVNIAGYAYDDDNGEISVTIWSEDQQLKVRFSDTGKPFNPLRQPSLLPSGPIENRKPGGLGIYMVRRKMDTVEYEFSGGRNQLTIGKNFDK